MTPLGEDPIGNGRLDPHADELLLIAKSIADGYDLDQSLGANPSGRDADPGILDELRVIAQVAYAHRQAALDCDPGASRARSSQPAGERRKWAHLEVIEPLGAGSFGTVYRAHDPQLRRDVALKIYRVAPGDAATLSVEGQMLARIRHANVVCVHGVTEVDGEVGLWLELVDGRTLSDEIKASGPIGFREATLVGLDICKALAAVHQAGLLHRDVKPQNVMRERGGRIVLMDFGLGRDRREVLAGDASGTPLYLAPEVFAGSPHSARSDIYSLGVLLYFLVAGTHPVVGRDRDDLEQRHQDGRRQLLRDVRSDLPEAFVDVVERACCADPSRRFATVGAMQAALAAVFGAREQAPPSPEPVVTQTWWRSPVALLGLAATLLLVLAAGYYASSRPGPGSFEDAPPAVAVAAAPPAVAEAERYAIDARFYRQSGDKSDVLATNGRVAPGDRLFAEIRADKPVYLYIVNHDDRGESYLLFPLPGQSVSNPLETNASHRLPGRQGAEDLFWQVTSAGGREHFVLVASREPLPALEAMLARLPKPVAGRPVSLAEPLSAAAVDQLRGVGGLSAGPTPARTTPTLFGTVPPLKAGREDASGTWIRQLTLENPAGRH